MTTTKKLVIAVVALSLALIAFAGTTLAWLISTPDPVTNTFTAGDVQITLDEAPTSADGYGVVIDGNRVTKNSYKLVPGRTYAKDPTVHVQANSEPCYVFVKIENQLVNVIDSTTDIETQIITTYGWIKLSDNLYYKEVDTSTSVIDLIVFNGFKVDEDATNTQISANDNKNIIVTAYAVQMYGFDSAVEAWEENFKNK